MLRKLDYICARVWENLKVVPLIVVLCSVKAWVSAGELIDRIRRK